MKRINIDEKWTFQRGYLDNLGALEATPGVIVDLPHDSMVGTPVDAAAPANYDWGYFRGDYGCYTKYIEIPEEWKDESIGLRFDGAMMNTRVDINGYKVTDHHYGYSPFYVDISRFVTFGEKNRVTVSFDTGKESSCRWYPGAGIYRSVELCHGPSVHIANDGIYLVTKEISDGIACLEAQVEIVNETRENRLVEVTLELYPENAPSTCVKKVTRVLQVNPGTSEVARQAFVLEQPMLWDAEHPKLYRVKVNATDKGEYRTHLIPVDGTTDEAEVLFGVRSISVDSVRGLRVNGQTVKLRGGCVHHDNGLIGAASLYACEERRVKKLKEIGFNAIRTAHNPPSEALIEACDRLGMYIMDEAFDAWGMSKRIGDFSNYFEYEWEQVLTDYIRRDRSHPSVILWSTGNEIPERGGLGNGYTIATKLAEKIRSLDPTRPICNGICSYWSGLDDYLAKGMDYTQNAVEDPYSNNWEKRSEPFTNGLDVVGYNYLEEHYENDHSLYPERVMVGSETFPQEIGFRWPMVEKLPYVIGDFTWTCWDYLGEAGIGKALYLNPDDPKIKEGPWGVMPPSTTNFPWRLANDADYDITGRLLPQGEYRSVVWGSEKTFVYSKHPDCFGKVELMSMWGFPYLQKSWNYAGNEGKPVEVTVFSSAEEVELLVNGTSVGRRPVNFERPTKLGDPMPYSVSFDVEYMSGVVEAVSYTNGLEVSRAILVTTKEPSRLSLAPERVTAVADGHDVIYVGIDVLDEDGLTVPDAELDIHAEVSGAGYLAGFGSGNPITEDNYSDGVTRTYRGHAMVMIRTGYHDGNITLKVCGGNDGELTEVLNIASLIPEHK